MSKKCVGEAFTETMNIELLDDRGATAPLLATFNYDPADPYAVSVLFHLAPDPCRWTFARELLIDGFFTPTGAGDVVVFPCLDSEGRAVVVVHLVTPTGQAYFQLASRAAAAFIDRMLTVVPRGTESVLPDLDAELLRIVGSDSVGGLIR